MPISVVFDPPLPSDSPSTFNTKAFTLLGDLNDWSTQANALPGEVATNLTTLLASPPAIGSTTPAAVSATALSASGGVTNTAGRSNFSSNDAYAIGAKNTGGGPVYFGATDSTASPGGHIANAGGVDIISWTNAGAVTIPGSLASGKHTVKQSGDSYLASLGLVVERSTNDTFISLGYDSVSDSSRIYTSYSSTGAYKPLTMWTGDAERMRIDTAGNTTFNSGTFGYGVGAGGTVTQATSKSTAVTLNKPCGQITMNNAALAAGANVNFVVNNTTVAYTDSIILTGYWGAVFSGNYRVETTYVGTGSFGVSVTNITAGSLSEALQVNFSVIKGATS